jgi:autotransporter passenger strand-loop-strand repeat protein
LAALLGGSLTGGVANAGIVSGSVGIVVTGAHGVKVFDAGIIVGTGGTAVALRTAANTFTLESGYSITGLVIGSGGNTFQLGGTGAAKFNLSSIGSGAQYRGFTTVSGAGSGWNVNGGTLALSSGGFLGSTTVKNGGTVAVHSGASVTGIVSSGGALELVGAGASAPGVTLSRGAYLEFASGAITGKNVSAGFPVKVLAGGIESGGTSAAGQITTSYLSANAANTSGTLFVSSGGRAGRGDHDDGPVLGEQLRHQSGSGGTVEITDPTVPNGGTVALDPAAAFPRGGIDLPNIAFGAHTTLAYSENAAGTGGTLTVSDGRHAASIALLGSYTAGSFVAAADGHGGTLVTQAQPQQQPLVIHPKA